MVRQAARQETAPSLSPDRNIAISSREVASDMKPPPAPPSSLRPEGARRTPSRVPCLGGTHMPPLNSLAKESARREADLPRVSPLGVSELLGASREPSLCSREGFWPKPWGLAVSGDVNGPRRLSAVAAGLSVNDLLPPLLAEPITFPGSSDRLRPCSGERDTRVCAVPLTKPCTWSDS